MVKTDEEKYNSIEERRKRWENPKITVKSETEYTIVAKDKSYSSKRPYHRLNKYRDENGIYVVIRRNKKVYEENWDRE